MTEILKDLPSHLRELADREHAGSELEVTLRVAADQLATLHKIVADNLDHSADGVLLCEHDGPLYCPNCGDKVQHAYDLCYCWSCPNPDSYGEIPLPLFYSMVLVKPPARSR